MTRSGIGYDLHRLAEGRKLMIGGIEVPHDKGSVGHSDGDVLSHALCDALLGAAGLGDIGTHAFNLVEYVTGDVVTAVCADKIAELEKFKSLMRT